MVPCRTICHRHVMVSPSSGTMQLQGEQWPLCGTNTTMPSTSSVALVVGKSYRRWL